MEVVTESQAGLLLEVVSLETVGSESEVQPLSWRLKKGVVVEFVSLSGDLDLSLQQRRKPQKDQHVCFWF